MQIKETTNEGLKRGYTLTIAQDDIASRIDAEVKKIAPQVKMPGFRPGKVPANLVRKMHGEQLHAQTLNDVIRENVDQLMKEKSLRPAMQPAVNLEEGYEEGKDAIVTVDLEVLPKIETPDTDNLKLERLTVPVSDEAVDESLQNIAGQQKSYKNAPKTRKAKEGDQLIIDFTGSIDGEEFEGGKAEDAPLVIGAGQFIPGFEDQLTGAKTGDEKTITVNFPDDYPAENLKGKEAQFDIVVKQVKVESETKLDDDFATSLGLESMDKLKELLKGQLEQETNGLTRTQMKRQLLDQLAGSHDFDVPEKMVDAEFEQIWAQLQQEAAKDENPEKAMKEIESEKDEYRHIAERRVRLGLLLSEIGQNNKIEVTQQEMSMLIQQAAQQYREDDREKFMQYIQQEPMAAAQLRAPLYEDKVVDFLFEKADITEREVTKAELEAAIEADEAAEEAAAKKGAKKSAAKKKPAAKKTPAKKTSKDEKAPAKKSDVKKPAVKKAAPKKDAADKPAAKKTATKKTAPKKDAEKKDASKKTGAKKPAAKKTPAKK